jgi:hypothetical protein
MKCEDTVSDDFVSWLNSNKLLERVDWKYEEMKSLDAEYHFGCLSPKDIWRANRYQQRID